MAGDVLPLMTNVVNEYSTTSNGAADGSTAIVSSAGQVNNFYLGMTLSIINATNQNLVKQQREIVGYLSGTGTFIVKPPFTAQIASGTIFQVVQARPIDTAGASPVIGPSGFFQSGSTTTGVDTTLTGKSDSYYNGGMLLMITGANAGLSRSITAYTDAAGTVTVSPAFPNAIATNDEYAIYVPTTVVAPTDSTGNISWWQVIGSKADAAVLVASATASIIAYLKGIIAAVGYAPVLTKATLGASNFFAGAVNVISLTPAGPSYLSGVTISISGFTATATITIRIFKMTNGVEDQILQTTRIAGTDQPGVVIIDSPDSIDGNGALNTWRVSLQSNNAADTAVTPRYQYTLQRFA